MDKLLFKLKYGWCIRSLYDEREGELRYGLSKWRDMKEEQLELDIQVAQAFAMWGGTL